MGLSTKRFYDDFTSSKCSWTVLRKDEEEKTSLSSLLSFLIRLIRLDLETGKIRILDDQLVFPNGVQLSADKHSVLVCETALARVIKHSISGPNSETIGKSEVFIDNLPGLPDNIRLTSTGNYWIAFAAVRHKKQPSIFDHLRNWPRIRALLSVSR